MWKGPFKKICPILFPLKFSHVIVHHYVNFVSEFAYVVEKIEYKF